MKILKTNKHCSSQRERRHTNTVWTGLMIITEMCRFLLSAVFLANGFCHTVETSGGDGLTLVGVGLISFEGFLLFVLLKVGPNGASFNMCLWIFQCVHMWFYDFCVSVLVIVSDFKTVKICRGHLQWIEMFVLASSSSSPSVTASARCSKVMHQSNHSAFFCKSVM